MRKSLTLCVLFFSVLCLTAWGQQQGPPPSEGPGLAGPVYNVTVEFSNLPDRQAVPPGLDGLDPTRVLFSVPPDSNVNNFPNNSIKYGATGEVDALANWGDYLYDQVVINRADLVVSFQGDPPGATVAAYFETRAATVAPNKGRGVEWFHTDLCNISDDGPFEDLDALEVFGPMHNGTNPQTGWDTNLYSLAGEPGGTSIFASPNFAGPSNVYVTQAQIYAAITNAALNTATGDPFSGTVGQVDVDGLMATCYSGCDGTWGPGDEILISIKPAANWDGGEIVRIPFGGVPSYLNHGNHPWDTGFGVAAAFNVNTENVDAIEAVRDSLASIPAVSNWGFLVMGLLVLTVATLAIRGRRMRAAGA